MPEPEPEPLPKAATPTAAKKMRTPAGSDPVVMPRTTSPLGDMQFGALGISFGMLSTEDKSMSDGWWMCSIPCRCW
jgi:hypothetical protein